jgi:hypothetical protein
MTRKFSLFVALLGALAIAACGSDKDTTGGGDGGQADPTKTPDAGVTIPDTGTTPTPDTQVQPQPDQGTVDPTAGWGSTCNQTTPCGDGMFCAYLAAGNGFCTKPCTNSGAPCANPPAGTMPYCALQNPQDGSFGCAFICKVIQGDQQQAAQCPAPMVCEQQGRDQGNGQIVHLCVPPPA